MHKEVVDTYQKDQVATIRGYSGIFDPYLDPLSWNTRHYGDGETYNAGDKYTVVSSLLLYGQYDIISCYYHLYNHATEACQMHVGDEVVIDSSLSSLIDGFWYWQVSGDVYFGGERFSLSNTTHILPHSRFATSLTYDGNHADEGYLSASEGTWYKAVSDSDSNYDDIYSYFRVCLPENPYVKEGYRFIGWNIAGSVLQPGQYLDISTALTAYARWQLIQYYPLCVYLEYAGGEPQPEPEPTPTPGYTELKYIESSGTQYIDTGLVGTLDSDFQLKMSWMSFTSWAVIFGAESYDNARDSIKLRHGSSNWAYRFDSRGADSSTIPQQINVEYSIDFNKQRLQINDKTVTIGATSLPTPSKSIWLFTENGWYPERKSSIRLYYFKWYKGETLVRDMIPVIDPNGVYCMYDKVSNTYFYNKGTGVFTGETEDPNVFDIAQATVINFQDTVVYTGTAITQTAMQLFYKSRLLTEGVQYSLTYYNNNRIGQASVVITGIGTYYNSMTKYFNIVSPQESYTVLTYTDGTSSPILVNGELKKTDIPSVGKQLKSVKFGDIVTSVGSQALSEYSQITLINPEQIETIRDKAFYRTSFKTTPEFSTATYIGPGAFSEAYMVGTWKFPYVTEVGESAFDNASTGSIKLPLVTTIPKRCFTTDVSGAFTDSSVLNAGIVTDIGESAFAYTGIANCTSTSVMKVGSYAFHHCSNLTAVSLQAKSISDHAFYHCTKLKSASLSKAQSIGAYAFAQSGLKNFNVPSTLQDIGDNAFSDCSCFNIFSLHAFDGMEPDDDIPSIGAGVFDNSVSATIYISEYCASIFKTYSNWNSYSGLFNTAVGYSLSFYENGGELPEDTEDYDSEYYTSETPTYFVVPYCIYTNEGYTFTGWNTDSEGTGESYAAGSVIYMDRDKNLYAQWQTT